MAKSKVRRVSASDLTKKAERMAADIVNKRKVDTIKIISYAFLMSLGDELGKEQIDKVIERYKDNLLFIRDNEITMKDISGVLIEDYNLDLENLFNMGEK